MTFQDEFRNLLDKYEIKFDERYVWDRNNPCSVAGEGWQVTQGSLDKSGATLG
jgi:hypothetical protein